MAKNTIEIDERLYPELARRIELDNLTSIAKAHYKKTMIHMFAKVNQAIRVPFTEVFVMNCPNCKTNKLYFDTNNFTCIGCNIKGDFIELEKLAANQEVSE